MVDPKSLGSIASIGPVMQLAFVPDDFDAAIKYWTEVMGVGPFIYMPNAGLQNVKHRGQPSNADFGLALSYWGDMQIELIKLNNDEPCFFKEWLDAGKQGLNHVCVLADDISSAREICANAGATVLLEAEVAGGGEVIYVETGGGDGTIVEILMLPASDEDPFAMVKQAAKDWDGTVPLIQVG